MAEPATSAPRRREHTRERLLDAALDVFADQGFGRSTVEQICGGAGFTRGAFYSNFTSLDELFLAMWERQSALMLARFRGALSQDAEAPGSGGNTPSSLPAAVARILSAIPVEDRWYRITAEFSAHALRNPELTKVIAARERAIRETMLPIVEAALARFGRRVEEPELLGRALVAMHDGTTVQALMEPRENTFRTELFVRLVYCYSTEVKE